MTRSPPRRPPQSPRLLKRSVLLCQTQTEYLQRCVEISERGIHSAPLGQPALPILKHTARSNSCISNPTASYDAFVSTISCIAHRYNITRDDRRVSLFDPLSDRVVLATFDAFSTIALAYALLTRSSLVIHTDYHSLIQLWLDHPPFSSRTVIHLAEPRSLSQVPMGRRPRTPGVTHADIQRVGYITSSCVSSLTRTVFRLLTHAPTSNASAHLFVQRDIPRLSVYPPGMAVTTLPQHPTPHLERLRASSDYTHYVGHGRHYCALSGNLCTSRAKRKSHAVQCIGPRDCVFAAWPRRPARHLRARTVVLESCSTGSLTSVPLVPGDYSNIAIALMDGGATMVVAPLTSNDVMPLSSSVMWLLASAGNTAGDLCHLMNALTRPSDRGHVSDALPFILYGDPDLQPFAARYTVITTTFRRMADERGICNVHLSGERQPLVIIDRTVFAGADYAVGELRCESRDGAGRVAVRYWVASPMRLYVVLRATSTIRDVLIRCTFHVIRSTLAVTQLRELTHNFRVYRRYAEHMVNSAQSYHAAFHRYKTMLESARDIVEDACLARPPQCVGQSAAEVWHTWLSSYVAELCRDADVLLADIVMARAGRIGSLWPLVDMMRVLPACTRPAVHLTELCSRCGSRMSARQYTLGAIELDERVLTECERCLFVLDVANGGPRITIDGVEENS